MKKLVKTVTAIIMVSSMAMATGVTTFAAETAQNTIQVNGEGIITAKPDQAILRMTVETKEKTADQAQKKNAETVAAVTKALQAIGVHSEDIVTGYYSVDPDTEYNETTKKWVEVGYGAYHQLTVTVKGVDNVAKYTDAATEAGVTSIDSVSFSLADTNQYYEQALQAAVKNAQSSAAALAEAIGKPLGACISIEERSSNQSYERQTPMLAKSNMAVETAADASGSGADIRYEDMEVTANVVMIYTY